MAFAHSLLPSPSLREAFSQFSDMYPLEISYGFNGKIVAASFLEDKKILILEQIETGEWTKTATIKLNHSSISKIDWTHPEFGNIIVSCTSKDRLFVICEKIQDNWNVSTIQDLRSAVTDVKIAPRHWGLKVAVGTDDGHVRIYESSLCVMNKPSFNPVDEFEVGRSSISCLSWNPSRYAANPMLVVASKKGSIQIWENRQRWTLVQKVHGDSDSQVHCVAWASDMGRKYSLIAAAVDKRVHVWRIIKHSEDKYEAVGLTSNEPDSEFQELKDMRGQIIKLEWNATTTALAAYTDDGKVCLWRSNLEGCWNVEPVLIQE